MPILEELGHFQTLREFVADTLYIFKSISEFLFIFTEFDLTSDLTQNFVAEVRCVCKLIDDIGQDE